ncbi:MAG: T9SS type A sorting domain-containing protein [Bacteroidota bacterium]|nr:T9SS type A sorting domain-containing protein [Bacteroidota bacterium]
MVFLSICYFQLNSIAQLNWSASIDSVSVLSSPRSVDLNNDGIKDVVIGSGTDSAYSNYGVVAINGANGQVLWTTPTRDEIFSSAQFLDVNNDAVKDVIIGGRDAQLLAINGVDGSLIWEFYPHFLTHPPADSGYYNFYSSQLIPDITGDNLRDILVTNGGDHQATQFDPRPPGHLMIIDAMNGSKIAQAVSPDSAEIYCSPVVYDRAGGSSLMVAFGTGGENHGGGFYIANINDVLNNSLANNAILLQSDSSKGFIAPASLADMTNDGIADIIIQSFGGSISAFDGFNFIRLWDNHFPDRESSAAPTLGNFTGGDLIPDVFTVMYRGSTPTYFDYYQIMINGATGQVTWTDSLGDMHFSSSSAFDANGDGRDEVLCSVNEISGSFKHQLKLIDFQNATINNLSSLESGVNLGCTPLIDDLNDDGLLEIVYVYKLDSLNPSAWTGFRMKSLQTSYAVPYRGMAFSSYMGTNFDGHYTNELVTCSTTILNNHFVEQPSCNGFTDGKIVLTNFASSTNTILWSDGSILDSLTNIQAGNYVVYLTDTNNCVELHNFQLIDPYSVAFGNISHNVCPGDSIGTATISSTGCVCQFSTCTYNWSSGSLIKHATQLPEGMHTVEIHHPDGCIVIDSIYINDGIPVIDSSFTTSPSCSYSNDASITLIPSFPSATGCSWSNGTSLLINDQLSPGHYSVEVYNMNCTDSLFFTVQNVDPVTFSHTVSNVLCHGEANGEIQIDSFSGDFPYNTVLNGVIYSDSVLTQLSPGYYQLYTIDNNNCYSDTVIFQISEPDPLSLTFNVTPATDSSYFDGIAHAIVQGGTTPYNYVWDHLPFLNDSVVIYLTNGFYPITVTDNNGCQIIDSAFVGLLSNIDSESSNFIEIYPNPSKGSIHIINTHISPISYTVYDTRGLIVKESKALPSSNQINLDLPIGTYFIRFTHYNDSIFKKIIIN